MSGGLTSPSTGHPNAAHLGSLGYASVPVTSNVSAMTSITDRVFTAIAILAFAASVLTAVAQFSVVPHAQASAKALSKECAAYAWGKRGWGCARVEPLTSDPTPTLVVVVVLFVVAAWFVALESVPMQVAAPLIYGVTFLLCAVVRAIGYFFAGLATINYLYGAGFALTAGILLLWFAGVPSGRVRTRDAVRKKRANALMEQEVALRIRTRRRP